MIQIRFASPLLSASIAVVCFISLSAAGYMALHKKRKAQKYSKRTDDTKRDDGNLPPNPNCPSNDAKTSNGVTSLLPPHIQREMLKEKRRKSRLKDLAMKKPMYDNVRMVDQEGELLSTISKKKAEWYVEKNLAEFTNDAKMQIRLLFEPKNRSSREEHGTYITAKKVNQCVVCGEAQHHMRFYIVPYSYRTLFPKKFKSHLAHDIVILCHYCHIKCDQYSQVRVKELEERVRPKGWRPKFEVDKDLYQVQSCAHALLKWNHKIPESKRLVMEQTIHSHFGIKNGSDLSNDQLQKAASVNYRVENKEFVPGADLVVRALEGNDELIGRFVREWRQYFLETGHPRYLSPGWSINSPVVCGGS
mmetsp:Transcript_5882/g.6123  ORF Transcript_5882/g.6123 Transcript_5882/m.6123 type:complete len:361 (-) Transcript_5882:964-2046(-)